MSFFSKIRTVSPCARKINSKEGQRERREEREQTTNVIFKYTDVKIDAKSDCYLSEFHIGDELSIVNLQKGLFPLVDFAALFVNIHTEIIGEISHVSLMLYEREQLDLMLASFVIPPIYAAKSHSFREVL